MVVLEELMLNYMGGYTVPEPIDISGDLPRHETKKHATRTAKGYKRIAVHTTDWVTTPEKLAKYDIGPNHISDTGCPGITYHDLIMKDGSIFHTLPYDEVSWHVGNFNSGSLAVALMYKCTIPNSKDQLAPTEDALKSLQTHCGDLCLKYSIEPKNVVGHRELFGTGWFWQKGSRRLRKSCPGKRVDLDLLRHNVATYMQIRLKMKGLYKGAIDGDFGKKSIEALALYKEKTHVS